MFVAFFPKLVSGPIERAENLLPQMRDGQGEWGLGASFDFDRMRRGLLLMVWGLFLKLVIADRAALLVDTVFPKYWEYNGLQLAVAAVCFSIQLYCDFGGYSAVAIGAAQVLGFRLQDNFHQPYLALSIRDFWRRWHISLSGWFRDYLYIPLGGNRKGRARTYFNTMVTMLLSGLWHGAGWNYVVWGGLHGVYQVAGDVLRPARDRVVERLHIRREALVWKVLRGLITFGLVTLAWIFFRAESTRAALGLISGIISRFTLSLDGITGLGLDWKDLLVLLIAVLVLLTADLLGQNMQVRDRILALPLPARVGSVLSGGILHPHLRHLWGELRPQPVYLWPAILKAAPAAGEVSPSDTKSDRAPHGGGDMLLRPVLRPVRRGIPAAAQQGQRRGHPLSV